MKNLTSVMLMAAGAALAAPAHASDACRQLYETASEQFADQKLDDAAATFAKGYAQCGGGQGFLQAQGFVRASQGKIEEAAELYLKEISEPGPKPEAFGNLERIRDKLSPKTKARIVAMGATAQTPVYVLGIKGEYSWARAFTCLGARSFDKMKQSITKGPRSQMLDVLTFSCPGETTTHVVYFDYGEDPMESQYLRERQAIEEREKQQKKK